MENKQTALWSGDFGNSYVDRNPGSHRAIAAVIKLWSEILGLTINAPPQTIIEVGANVGINLRALKILTEATLFAVEPNDRARAILLRDGVLREENIKKGIAQSLPFRDGAADLVFTSGVLVHIHPDHLRAACSEIHRCAARYIGCVEYFSDQPETAPYRDQTEALFKRDFGSYWLDEFPGLRTLGYGFVWKRITGLGNATWWLFEKHQST
jgi:pseudaminic acid biosynthesis-associated methylase